MPRATRICRVCGSKYKACVTPSVPGEFRWQDVACSPECGKIYLDAIIASRTPAPVEQAAPKKSAKSKKRASVAEPVVEPEVSVAEEKIEDTSEEVMEANTDI